MSQNASPPGPTPRAIRKGTLFMLVLVVFLAVLVLVVRAAAFVISPDPGVRAGPMYVTLTLCTISALLMLILALNASFLPILTRQRERDLRLITGATGGTGVVTGMLTVGAPAQMVVAPLFIATIAFVFIWIQEIRIDRARRSGPTQRDGSRARTEEPAAHGRRAATPKNRQRRGGRKR